MPVGSLDLIIDRIRRLKKQDRRNGVTDENLLSGSADDGALAANCQNRPVVTVSKVKSLSRRNASARVGGLSKWRDQSGGKGCAYSSSESDHGAPVDPQLSHLESLECFAAHFRRKRIMLGYTQQQVGDTLGRRYNAYFSQTTISRFEDLNLSVRNMSKLRPLIQRWIVDTERAVENGAASIDVESEREEVVCNGALGRRRRKRTTIDDRMKSFLENVFKTTPRPTTLQIEELASQLSLRTEVVRVWFCNRRQREARGAAVVANSMEPTTTVSSDHLFSNDPPMLQPYFIAGDGGSDPMPSDRPSQQLEEGQGDNGDNDDGQRIDSEHEYANVSNCDV